MPPARLPTAAMPYSHFSVGAAARLANGIVVTGTNRENAAYRFRAVCRTHHPIHANSQHPDQAVTTSPLLHATSTTSSWSLHPPAAPARQVMLETEKRFKAANAGVAVWQKGNLRAEECGRITATLVRCFGHEVTEPIKILTSCLQEVNFLQTRY